VADQDAVRARMAVVRRDWSQARAAFAAASELAASDLESWGRSNRASPDQAFAR